MTPITFTVANTFTASNLTQSFTVNDPLLPGAFQILKQISGSTNLGTNIFTFVVSSCAVGSTATNCITPTQVSTVTIDNTHNPVVVSNLPEGFYLVHENPVLGFATAADQIVKVVAGSSCPASCTTVTFNNLPATFNQITPTGTTCGQFTGGTASTLTQVTYSVSGGKISTDNPGVFFYYAKLVAANSGAQTITITQSADQGGSTYLFHVLNDSTSQVILYDANCNVISGVTKSVTNPAAVTVTLPSTTTAGQVFIVSVKYTPKSLIGLAAPNPTTINYTFGSTGTVGTQGLALKKAGT
jgi:hypothetical protein